MSNPPQSISKRQALANLRTILAELFVEVGDIQVVADDAGLDLTRIDFAGPSIRVWQAVLKRAAAEKKVPALAAAAADHYEEARVRLLSAADAYATARPDPPWRLVMLGVGAFGIVLFAGYLLVAKPWQRIEPMSSLGQFNLAMARFPVVDATGHVRNDCVSDLISTWIYDTIRQPAGVAQQVIIDDIRGPTEIGIVDEGRAAQLAEEINATVVVYGVITATGQTYTFQPTFYVRDSGHAFAYGSEIAGPNQLGQPVQFVLPPEVKCENLTKAQIAEINHALNERIAILGHVITGLAFFFQELYSDAAYWFDLATRQTAPRLDAPGQAVVQLLLGSARLREASPAEPATQAERLDAAERAFQRAVALNPQYSRGYLGLGIVALEKAKVYNQIGTSVDALFPEQLTTARAAFMMALTATDQPSHSYVPMRAALGIGIAHTLGVEFGIPGWSAEEAAAQFTRIIETQASSGGIGLNPTAALAHGYLGKLAQLNSDWIAMKDHCEQTVQLLSQAGVQRDASTLAEAWSCVALADRSLGHSCDAIDAYAWAVSTGSEKRGDATVVAPAKLAKWQEIQNALRPLCNGEKTQP